MSNIIKAHFLEDSKTRLQTEPLFQYDYGQVLDLSEIDGLPAVFEAHFCNKGDASSTAGIGTDGQVTIPDAYLQTGKYIYIYVYLHTGESDGETEYKITVPVAQRASVTHEEPTPVQQSEIEQLITALDAGVDAAEAAKDTILGMRAEASSLPAGSDATASYSDGVMSFGIPRGAKGDDGSAGPGVPAGGSSGDILIKTGSPDYQTGWTAFDDLTTQEIQDIIDEATGADPGQPRHLDTLPAGGTAGQVLAKASSEDYDAEWVTPSGGGTSDYDQLSNRPQINGNTLTGNKTAAQLGLAAASDIPTVPVQSVNGQTGAVVLGAADVGAKPSSYEAPVASVNGKTGAVVLDASDVGAGTYSKPSGGIPDSDIASASTWNAKGTYSKPSGGIPKTDLASAVQTSLGKADTAYQKPSGGIPASDIASGVIPTVPTKVSDLTNDSGFVNASGAAAAAPVQSVNGQTGDVSLTIPSSAADVGAIAAPSSPSVGDFLVYSSSGWTAQTLSVWQGGSY